MNRTRDIDWTHIRTHISCDLILYGAPELDRVTNYKDFDAVHEFISSTDWL